MLPFSDIPPPPAPATMPVKVELDTLVRASATPSVTWLRSVPDRLKPSTCASWMPLTLPVKSLSAEISSRLSLKNLMDAIALLERLLPRILFPWPELKRPSTARVLPERLLF